MGNMSTLINTLARSKGNGNYRKNGNGSRRKNGNGNGNGKHPPSSHKFRFEPIEPRILLSSDLTYAGSTAFDLTLKLRDDGTTPATLQLIDNSTDTAVIEQALADMSGVTIYGSSESDHLTIDFSSLFELPNGITIQDSSNGDSDIL